LDPLSLLLGALAVIATGAFILTDVGTVVLQPIEVPQRLEQGGYTSANFTHLVMDEIERIYFTAGSDYTGADVQMPSSGVTLEVAGANISLSDLKVMYGKATGGIQYEIEGSVVDSDGKLVLRLGTIKASSQHNFITETAPADQPYALVLKAAEDIVGIVDPYVAMKHQFEADKIAGNFTKSLTMIADLLPHMPPAQRYLLYDIQGRAYDVAKQPDNAIAAYRKSIELNPDYPIAYSNLALTLREVGRASEADEEDRKAATLSPNFFAFFRFWAEAYRRAGMNDRCVYNFSRYLHYAQADAAAYYDMGSCLRAEGQAAQAADAFSHARALDPELTVPP
jgi:tetratricopeptide (TPR) repeat protein